MENFFYKISPMLERFVPNIIFAVAILIVGGMIARIIANLVAKSIVKAKSNQTLASFVRNLVYFALMAFVLIAALNKLGIQTASFIAVLGAASLAIGLALQGSLSNFASGVMLIIFHPFKVGDLVETVGAQGTVEEIQIFNTVLVTQDKKKVIIPNSKVTGDKIIVFPKQY
jgi:small conductance mechanosensitive channel